MRRGTAEWSAAEVLEYRRRLPATHYSLHRGARDGHVVLGLTARLPVVERAIDLALPSYRASYRPIAVQLPPLCTSSSSRPRTTSSRPPRCTRVHLGSHLVAPDSQLVQRPVPRPTACRRQDTDPAHAASSSAAGRPARPAATAATSTPLKHAAHSSLRRRFSDPSHRRAPPISHAASSSPSPGRHDQPSPRSQGLEASVRCQYSRLHCWRYLGRWRSPHLGSRPLAVSAVLLARKPRPELAALHPRRRRSSGL